MHKDTKVDNGRKKQIVKKPVEYQFLLESLKERLINLKEVTGKELDDLKQLMEDKWLMLNRHADAISIINKRKLFIGFTNGVAEKGFYKLKAFVKTSRVGVKKISIERGFISVNDRKTNFKYRNTEIAANCAEFLQAQMTIKTLCSILQPKHSKNELRLVEDYNELFNSYMDCIEELDNLVFSFNKVGGKFTRHYKLFARFKLDKRLSNPLLALGIPAFFQVYGGNHLAGIRYSRPINKLPGVKSEFRLTSEAIRKAKLSRFEKDYLAIGKKITTLSLKANNHKQKLLKINKVLNNGITKQA